MSLTNLLDPHWPLGRQDWEVKTDGPYLCPVCQGSGKIERRYDYISTTSPQIETCHACNGKGIVWRPKT